MLSPTRCIGTFLRYCEDQKVSNIYWILLYKLSYDNVQKIDMTIYGNRSIVWSCDFQHMLMASNQVDWWKNEIQISNGCLDTAMTNLQCNCKGQLTIIVLSITHDWKVIWIWGFHLFTPDNQFYGFHSKSEPEIQI